MRTATHQSFRDMIFRCITNIPVIGKEKAHGKLITVLSIECGLNIFTMSCAKLKSHLKKKHFSAIYLSVSKKVIEVVNM